MTRLSTPEERAELVRLYLSGKTRKQAALDMGRSETWARSVLVGVVRSPSERQTMRWNRRRFIPICRKLIEKHGATLPQVVKILEGKVSHDTLKKHMQRDGVKVGKSAGQFRHYWNRLTPQSSARFDKAVLAAQLEAEGYTRPEIAKQLGVGLQTIHRYRTRLREGIPYLDTEAAS